MTSRRMSFILDGRDRLSDIFHRAGDSAEDLDRRIDRAMADASSSVERFSRDADGRLHDAAGRFVSTGDAARRMGLDLDGGARMGLSGLRGLAGGVAGLGSSLAGAAPQMGGASGALSGIGVAAGVTALPAIAALVPMAVGLGAAFAAVKVATSGVGEALALAGTDAAAYREALADMPPEQRKFTEALADAKGELSGMGREVQKAMLPGWTKAVEAADPALRIFRGGVKDAAGVLGEMGEEFGDLFGSDRFQTALKRNFELGAGFLGDITEPLDDFVLSLLELGAEAEPVLDAIGEGLGGLMGKGLPGFFEGLEDGIGGTAAMFDGLFSAVNKVLPALGDLAGATAEALGPELGEMFDAAGDTGAESIGLLADGVGYLKPLFGEVAGAARIMSVGIGVVGDVARQTGSVVMSSLWPSFADAKQAEGPLQRVAGWLKDNKVAVQEFGRQASNGIITFVDVAVGAAPEVIKGFRLMTTGILTALDGIVSGAAKAFGWVPGIGGKLKRANESFDTFKNKFIGGLHDAEDGARQFAQNVGPRLERNKLKMNIDNWRTQIATAKAQMKSVPPEKRAELRAKIDDLQAKVRRARAELNGISSKTITITTNYVKNYLQGRSQHDIVGATGGQFTGRGFRRGYDTGGFVRGPGTGTSDDVPAPWLSNGEYVIRAAAVSKYGVDMFDKLNAMRFAEGGLYAKGGKVSKAERKADRRAVSGDLRRFMNAIDDSASDIRRASKNLAGELDRLGKAGDRLAKRLDHRTDQITKLAGRRDAISERIKEAKGFAGDVTAGARAGAGLGTLFGSPEEVTAGGIRAGLQQRLGKIRQFARYIRELSKRGLNKRLLRQILEMGPEDGLAYASALAGTSKSTLADINAVQNRITDDTRDLGRRGADILYDEGKNAGKGFLNGLESQERAIEKQMERLAKKIRNAIRKALDSHSPSRVMAGEGRNATAGVAVGLLEGLPTLDRALAVVTGRVADARPVLATPAGYGAGGGAPTVVNITIQGAMDPVAVGREVQRVLLRLKRDFGMNFDLGLGVAA